jgi:MYXO-CTERM domain-containing protein
VFSLSLAATTLFVSIGAIAFGSSNASATTIHATPHATEHDLSEILDANGYTHSNSIAELNANQSPAETFALLRSDSEVTLIIEDAGYSNSNRLGIYSLRDTRLTATLFTGGDSAPSTATLVFGAGGLLLLNGSVVSSDFGSEFGFYLKNNREGFTWYSETAMNPDGYDHFVAFEDDGVLWAGFEDLRGGGDEDFNDLVFRMTSVTSVPVPEPSGPLAFAAGLLVASGAIRRRHGPR